MYITGKLWELTSIVDVLMCYLENLGTMIYLVWFRSSVFLGLIFLEFLFTVLAYVHVMLLLF